MTYAGHAPPSKPAWARVIAAETPGLHGLTTLAVSVVIVAALYLGREVLIPITLAVLLSFVLAPLVDLFRRIHLGRIPSVLFAVLVAVGVILALVGVVGIQLASVAGDLPHYQTTIRQKADTLPQPDDRAALGSDRQRQSRSE